jgi:hypothetical protein
VSVQRIGVTFKPLHVGLRLILFKQGMSDFGAGLTVYLSEQIGLGNNKT